MTLLKFSPPDREIYRLVCLQILHLCARNRAKLPDSLRPSDLHLIPHLLLFRYNILYYIHTYILEHSRERERERSKPFTKLFQAGEGPESRTKPSLAVLRNRITRRLRNDGGGETEGRKVWRNKGVDGQPGRPPSGQKRARSRFASIYLTAFVFRRERDAFTLRRAPKERKTPQVRDETRKSHIAENRRLFLLSFPSLFFGTNGQSLAISAFQRAAR